MPGLRLVFMGSPDFAVPILRALVDAGHDVARVYAQPPRPAGRGHRQRPGPVHAAAERLGLAVSTPRSLKDPAEQAAFADLRPDAAVVAAYGLLLPRAVLDVPRLGCINVHASLLPRWRGAAPIQRAILAGDRQSGVTIMQMDAGLDTGPMLMSEAVPITGETTAETLHDALSALGARLVAEALSGLDAGTLTPVAQPADGVTHAPKLARDEGHIDWAGDAAAIERMLRALNPWPGTWCEHDGERLRILAGTVVPGAAGAAPGTVVDGAPTIACGTGALRLTRLQRPGRGALDAADFMRGYPLPTGSVLA